MSTLVVFFSFEGNTKFIAEKIAETLHADTIALTTSKEYPKKGLLKYVWGGKSVVVGEEPELTNEHIDVDSYDTIILGTPIWAGSYAPPMKTFLKQYEVKGKRIALFACHAGGGAKKCFQKMKETLSQNEVIGQLDLIDPLKKDTEAQAQKAVKWAESLAVNKEV
jgi:flavodoxin